VQFEILDSLSLPGTIDKANEDAFAHTPHLAVVFDGATPLGESLLPGPSDAQWIARFAARRLTAHAEDSEGAPRDWLRAAAADAQKSFTALRYRAPREVYETPLASMIAAALHADEMEALWFGDCALLLRDPSDAVDFIGDTLTKRDAERARVQRLSRESARGPAAPGVRSVFLPSLRAARNSVNTSKGGWAFTPDPACAEHAKSAHIPVAPGTVALLASDGFLALISDYEAYDARALLAAAQSHGLRALGTELRTVESEDPEGSAYPRFKKSDDATALLLRVIA
jgi:serine/threonine protein phosphatase PrpC